MSIPQYNLDAITANILSQAHFRRNREAKASRISARTPVYTPFWVLGAGGSGCGSRGNGVAPGVAILEMTRDARPVCFDGPGQ
jgi:hypothetical protein